MQNSASRRLRCGLLQIPNSQLWERAVRATAASHRIAVSTGDRFSDLLCSPCIILKAKTSVCVSGGQWR